MVGYTKSPRVMVSDEVNDRKWRIQHTSSTSPAAANENISALEKNDGLFSGRRFRTFFTNHSFSGQFGTSFLRSSAIFISSLFFFMFFSFFSDYLFITSAIFALARLR